ncbi:conjugal transfer protein [Streptomyces sp. NPDC054975]
MLPVEASGWAVGSLGAAANAVTVLQRGAWVLLLAGPALGAWALLARPEVAVGAAAPERVAGAVVDTSAGPSGFAELFVCAYLEAGEGAEGSLAAFLPDAKSVVLSADPGSQVVEQVAAVRVRAVSDGYWSVTVAARVHPAKDASATGTEAQGKAEAEVLRYFRVPVRSGPAGALTAVSLPAEVGAPSVGKAPALAYGQGSGPSEADAGVRTLGGFFASYLAGKGELDRYMPPGSALASIVPAPYASVALGRIAEYGTNAPGAAFPEGAEIADGTQRRLLVDVTAVDHAGVERPLTYAVALKARDGRWEVEAVEAAPLLAVPAGSGATKEGSN